MKNIYIEAIRYAEDNKDDYDAYMNEKERLTEERDDEERENKGKGD